jgi:hypothetical protein
MKKELCVKLVIYKDKVVLFFSEFLLNLSSLLHDSERLQLLCCLADIFSNFNKLNPHFRVKKFSAYDKIGAKMKRIPILGFVCDEGSW